MSAPPRRENAAARAGATASDSTGIASAPQYTPGGSREEPEHRNDRRRFLVWAVTAGFVKPERLTERIVAEIAKEAP